ncbi:hypothetical protein [Fulvivirga lutimaris]|uniref:hypothetical protein n=1 Tax=Fulvivirga lutimaris TaxID=1819566 RepID=UPI0012BBB092|nr:hypothetical protein [Fulvivirga lutimaris]MTI39789.1 hypothetical protein [Fulvivirga lutimaris]
MSVKMDIDKLKELKTDSIKYSRTEINQIFELRTERSLKSTNRKMLIDLLLMGITTAILISITFFIGLQSRLLVSGQIAIIAGILIIHYRIKYMLLNNVDLSNNGIKPAITKIKNRLEGYIVFYQIALPPLFSLLMVKFQFDTYGGWNGVFNKWYYVAGTFVLSLVVVRFLCNKIYGKDMDRFKSLIDSLNNEV